MRVKILSDDERLGIKKGEIYNAERYRYDPYEKITLLGREPDGYDPSCNQYNTDVAYWMQGQWMVIEDGIYVPKEENNG
jgi:hypothetical protein